MLQLVGYEEGVGEVVITKLLTQPNMSVVRLKSLYRKDVKLGNEIGVCKV